MEGEIIAFILGAVFATIVSYYAFDMLFKSVRHNKINEQEKRIKQIEFENGFLEKKLNLKTIQYNMLASDVNEALSCDRKNIKDIIKKLDGR